MSSVHPVTVARTLKGKSQKALAAAVRLDPAVVSRIENGLTPNRSHIRKIARALDVEPVQPRTRNRPVASVTLWQPSATRANRGANARIQAKKQSPHIQDLRGEDRKMLKRNDLGEASAPVCNSGLQLTDGSQNGTGTAGASAPLVRRQRF